MKNIKCILLDKYQDKKKFELMPNGMYKNNVNGNYQIALSFELEDGEDTQYPIEDVMDTYCVNAGAYFEFNNKSAVKVLKIELEGSSGDNEKNRANISEISKFVGKRVYNKANTSGKYELTIE
jgi:hypothetical protein